MCNSKKAYKVWEDRTISTYYKLLNQNKLCYYKGDAIKNILSFLTSMPTCGSGGGGVCVFVRARVCLLQH